MSAEAQLKEVMAKILEGSGLKARMAMCLYDLSRQLNFELDQNSNREICRIDNPVELIYLLHRAEELAKEAFKEIGSKL